MPLVLDPPTCPATEPPSGAPGADGIGRLRGLLAALRTRTRRWVWIESLALVLLAGAAIFWASLAFDWLVEPPPWVRATLAAATAIGLAIMLVGKLFGRLAAPLDDASLATLLERGHPAFRDSLSTAIELTTNPRDDIDQTLLDRTVAEAVAVVDQVDPNSLFRRRRLVGLLLAGIAAAATIGWFAVARADLADIWVRRLVLLGDDPWPRRVGLSVDGFVAGRRKVARGGDVDLTVRADARKEIPEVIDLRSRGTGGWRTERMGMRGGISDGFQTFGHTLKGVNEDLHLEIRGGDARLRNLRLEVVDSPALDTLEITYTPPAYLGGSQRRASAARIVQVPEGSSAGIACTSTKPLSSATIVAIMEGREEVLATLAPPQGSETRAIAARIDHVADERTIVVRLTDTDGLPNREPISFVLSAVADEPPQVSLRMRGISTAITPRATIPLQGTISDDHGIAAAAVKLSVVDGPEVTLPLPRAAAGGALIDFPAATPERVAIEPLGLAPGRKVSITVTADDDCTLAGGPHTGIGDAMTLDVVAPEVLMAMLEAREIILRRRFESCIADLAQTRDRLAGGAPSPVARPDAADGDSATGNDTRLAEAASRAAGETAEIAEAFRLIRLELDNNVLLTPELEGRLIAQIADPLAGIAAKDLPALVAACRRGLGRDALVRQADDVLARMRAVLDKMMELESFNEVIELLRGVIRTQEEIRTETLQRQKQRAREALERP